MYVSIIPSHLRWGEMLWNNIINQFLMFLSCFDRPSCRYLCLLFPIDLFWFPHFIVAQRPVSTLSCLLSECPKSIWILFWITQVWLSIWLIFCIICCQFERSFAGVNLCVCLVPVWLSTVDLSSFLLYVFDSWSDFQFTYFVLI